MKKWFVSLLNIRRHWHSLIRNAVGFSLVEVMITAGIMGGLALTLTQVMQQANKGKKDVELRYEYLDVLNKMRMYLADAEVCRNTFVEGTAINNLAPYTFAAPTDVHPINALIRTTRNGTALGSPTIFYSTEAYDPAKGVIDRKLRITGMNLAINERDIGLSWPPTVRETRLFDVQVNFSSMGAVNLLPENSNRKLVIAADVDTAGVIQDCYTAWDQLSEQVCNDIGGRWDPIGAPYRCIIRDVVADYACEEMGGTINTTPRRGVPGGAFPPQVNTPLPLLGTNDPNDPLINRAQRVCDLAEVTKRDACTAVRGTYVDAEDRCSLVNIEDLRRLACTMAGGGQVQTNAFTQFSAAVGAGDGGSGAGDGSSYCQQTTEGACLGLGGTLTGDTAVGATDANCSIDCNNAATEAARKVCQSQQLCVTDLGGTWNSASNRCEIRGDSKVREAACTTFGGTWTGNNNGVYFFNESTGECQFVGPTRFCAAIGGTWVGAPTNQCQIGPSNERYDIGIKRMACMGMAITIDNELNPYDATRTYTATPTFTSPSTCTITYKTHFLAESEAYGRYNWKHPTESIGLFNGLGDGTYVDGGSRNVAVGYGAIADSGNSVAVGTSSNAGNSSIAIGASSDATATYSVAVGQSANAGTNNYATAVGPWATASGAISSAYGHSSSAAGQSSTAIGYLSSAQTDYSLAVGLSSSATGQFASAVGAGNTQCFGCYKKGVWNACCFSFTYGARAEDYKSTAIGAYAWSQEEGSTAIGAAATAYGTYTTAIGADAAARGTYTVALGYNAGTGTSTNYSQAFGYRANASATWALALGADTIASGARGHAIGDWSYATGDYSLAVGSVARATANHAIAIGANCNNSDDYSLRICANGDASSVHWNGAWSYPSSRTLKRNFVDMRPKGEMFLEELIELPLYEYEYTTFPSERKFYGPVAEEFYEAFKLGNDNKRISDSDMHLVSFLSIQALAKRFELMKEENKKQQERIDELEQKLEQLARDMEEVKAKR